MNFVLKTRWISSSVRTHVIQKQKPVFLSLYSLMYTTSSVSSLQDLCRLVSCGIGSLDDLEANLDKLKLPFTSSTVTEVLEYCRNEAPTRRLLRFFLWSKKNLKCGLKDEVFNHAIRVFSEKKDFIAIELLLSHLWKEERAMESRTFSVLADALVKMDRADEALGIFKNLNKFKCPKDSLTATSIISALCSKGHPRRAEGVFWHHKDKILGLELNIYRSLLHGWSVQKKVKEARRIIQEMKSAGIVPDLFCFNTFLRCLCERNVKSNPSGLVPEALNVMMEMVTYGIQPTPISYNILFSCLGRARRVKECLGILDTMEKSDCSPDWVSYYLVIRVLYLTGRFGKAKQIVDKMTEEGLVPHRKFFYDLVGILCGVERMNYALELFELMKKFSVGGYGPVFDVLIPKLCRGGDFDKGKELWNEATAMGITLQCSIDVLDPTITEVFKPPKKVEEEEDFLVDYTKLRKPVQAAARIIGKRKKGRMIQNKKRKKKRNTASR